MKRILRMIMTLCAAAVITAATAAGAYAAQGNVVYKGHADKFIFEPGSEYSPTDLFNDKFKGAMPGDRIKETIGVKNVSGRTVRIYMRSLGAADGAFATKDESAGFLSKLTITINGEKLAYDPEDGSSGWKLLGEFPEGTERNIDIDLEIPIELDNEYMSRMGYYLKWQFAVTDVNGADVGPDDNDAVKTGDYSNILLPLAAGLIALVAVIVLLKLRKKR